MGAYFFIGADNIFIYSVDIGNAYNEEHVEKILNYIFKSDIINVKAYDMKSFKSYRNMDADLFNVIVPFSIDEPDDKNKLISLMIGPLKEKKNDKDYKKTNFHVDFKKHSSNRLKRLLKKCYKLVEEDIII